MVGRGSWVVRCSAVSSDDGLGIGVVHVRWSVHSFFKVFGSLIRSVGGTIARTLMCVNAHCAVSLSKRCGVQRD